MSKEFKGKLRITPINPFTPRHAEIIELRANGLSNEEVAQKMGLATNTVKTYIVAIFDRIESITSERPPLRNWIIPMMGDVLLFRED